MYQRPDENKRKRLETVGNQKLLNAYANNLYTSNHAP